MQRLLSRMIHWHPPDPAGSPAERLTRGQDTREAMFRAEPMRGGALDAGDRCTRPGFSPANPGNVDRGGYRAGGGGRGACRPLLFEARWSGAGSLQSPGLVHRFQNSRPHLAFIPSPTERSPPLPHPAPSRGRGQSWRYPAGSRARNSAGDDFPEGQAGENRLGAGSPPGSPLGVDRGDIAIGGGDRGEGFPLPAGGYPYVPP